jgi:nicotinate-nucleotide adenylyltransferase
MKEVAIFGGTFDPPTLAHEAIVRLCLDRSDIDEVWLLPSGKRQDKPDMLDDPTRLAMLQAVQAGSFRDEPRLVVSDFEMQLPQPSETYKTVQALLRTYPDHRFWFVFGSDSYHDMTNWRRGKALRRSIGMLVVPREGYVTPNQNKRVKPLATSAPNKPLSSTMVRHALQHGASIKKYLNLETPLK